MKDNKDVTKKVFILPFLYKAENIFIKCSECSDKVAWTFLYSILITSGVDMLVSGACDSRAARVDGSSKVELGWYGGHVPGGQ